MVIGASQREGRRVMFPLVCSVVVLAVGVALLV
jgi:hypothetical protein